MIKVYEGGNKEASNAIFSAKTVKPTFGNMFLYGL